MRIYANYSQDEYNLVLSESKKLGFSQSAYVKYMNMSKRLKNTVDNNPDKYKFVKKLPGKINQYIKQ